MFVLGTSAAHAQAPGATPLVTVAAAAEPDPPPGLPIAVAVNAPFNWGWSIAASAWVGLSRHFALRANFARYGVFNPFADDDEDDDTPYVAPDFGHTTDVGVGLAYYPRRVLDGATFELGALTRLNRRRDRIDDQNNADDVDHTTVVGTRALIGWTWRLSDHWFVATAIGGSLGYERGSEKMFTGYIPNGGEMTPWSNVSRATAAFEYYVRVGMVFGQ